jgi:short-subunit dehydrogenase
MRFPVESICVKALPRKSAFMSNMETGIERFNSPPSRRCVVITGASAGVGRATAIEFARRGWNVGLIARGVEGLQGAKRDIEGLGASALVFSLDVADAVAVDKAAADVVAQWGEIDAWVNCAMATVYSPVHQMSAEEFRRVTEVTYLGYVYGTISALKYMRARNSGAIVQVGSALAYRAIPLQSAYCAAKFAIRGFTDALRSELLHDKSSVRLSMVQLPAVNTPQFDWARNKMPAKPQPVPPIFQPEAAARAIYRAAIEGPRELWVGSSSAKAIVGQIFAPKFLDKLLASRAYKGQMSDQTELAERPDNLFAPVDRDFEAHGRFSAHALSYATTIDPVAARKLIAVAAGIAAFAVPYLLVRGKRRA